jgi:NTP pyrophosphatase (non-canonical NTP hydrolase)
MKTFDRTHLENRNDLRMEELFEDVRSINRLDPVTPAVGLGKLGEEFGELCQAINKTSGRKAHDETADKVLDHIAVECADVIQNVFSLADKFGISIQHICGKMVTQNGKWLNNITKERIHI